MNYHLLKKTLCWRAISLVSAGFISVIYLGELKRPLILTGILTVTMTAINYLFELLWAKLTK